MWSSWSVLITMFCISKELQSSWRSVFQLCSNALMVVSPHALATLTDPFLLNLWPKTAFAQSAGSPYPLLVPFVSHLYGHFPHVWACNSVSRGCVHVRVFHMFCWWLRESNEAWSPVLCELSAAVPSSRSATTIDGLEGGLAVSCSHCSELGPALYISPGMFPSPWVELWSLPFLTSWESMWVLLLGWWSSELLGEWSCFFCVEVAKNLANGHLTRGVPIKENQEREVWWKEEFQKDELDCQKTLEQVTPLVQAQLWWQGCFHPVTRWSLMPHLCTEKKLQKKCTRAVAWLILLGSPWQTPPGRLWTLSGPSSPTSFHVSLPV